MMIAASRKPSVRLPQVPLLLGLALALALAGCVTKATAKAQAQAAFLAGQQQALERMQQQSRGPSVSLVGPVGNPVIPWTEDLTLAKALLQANYQGTGSPSDIIIVRNGRAVRVDLNKFLGGEDVPLQSGDVIQINPQPAVVKPFP